jgi:homocitrate synthase NifV
MIRLTDKTLTVLDTTSCPIALLTEFYELLLQIGVDYLEMDWPTAQRLGSALLPERTILRLEDPTQSTPGFLHRVCHITDLSVIPPLIHEIQINDVREISLLGRYQNYGNLRITGLSDLMLHDFTNAFQQIRKRLPIPLSFCPANDYGCAGAILTEWLMDGGNGVCTFMGVGGFAPTEEVVMALRLAKRHKPRLDISMLPRLCQLFTELSGIPVPPHKAVVGHAIFEVESGIHVDGILKNASNYEPFSPEVVGAQRRIIIGKHSGLGSLRHCLTTLGCVFPEQALPLLLETVRHEAVRLTRSLTDDEVLAFAVKVRVGL